MSDGERLKKLAARLDTLDRDKAELCREAVEVLDEINGIAEDLIDNYGPQSSSCEYQEWRM